MVITDVGAIKLLSLALVLLDLKSSLF